MHTILLCLWVLGVVSAADEESQRPIYIISPKGTPPGYTNGLPFFGAPVTSNNVKVLPNAYKSPQGVDVSSENPISVPEVVNTNTPFQGNTYQPIPVPVAYPDENRQPSVQPTLSTQSPQAINSLPIQRPPYPGVTPVPVLVKAPAPEFRSVSSSPRPFQVNPQQHYESSSENPFAGVTSSFRLWPKLPEPIPVPVLTADVFVRNSYRNSNTNLIPQSPQKVPLKVSSSKYQHNQIPLKFFDSSQFQQQSNNEGPVYITVPRGNTGNAHTGGQYQNPTQAPGQPQSPQNRQVYVLVQPNANSQSNQNEGYSSNQYFGTQHGQSGQQAPLNYAVLAPNTSGGQPQSHSVDQQSALKYAIFGLTNPPNNSSDSAGQAPQNTAVLAPESQPSKGDAQSPLIYGELRSADGKSRVLSSTTSPLKLFGNSSSQSSSPQNTEPQSPFNFLGAFTPLAALPQNFGFSNRSPLQYYGSSTQSPSTQNFGFSNQSPLQYFSSSTQSPSPQSFGFSNQSPLQYVSSTTQSPSQQNFGFSNQSSQQYVGSPTQSPSQQNFGFINQSPQQYVASPAQSSSQQNFGFLNQSPQQYVGSSTQSPSPQNFGYSTLSPPQYFAPSAQSPLSQNFGSPYQSPLQYFGSSTQSPPSQNFGSSVQSPVSQYFGSSTQPPPPRYFVSYTPQSALPQYFGSSTPSPSSQFFGSSTQSPLPLNEYSSSTQPPQYAGFSSTQAPSQPSYSQSSPLSRVSFSGAGGSYSYTIK